MRILITGGAGFIGSAVVHDLLSRPELEVVNVDKLTYAGNLTSLQDIASCSKYHFEQADITDASAMDGIFSRYQPDAVLHLAAESHVDRSINGPAAFVETNVVGTYVLLEVCRKYWGVLPIEKKASFRFLHISTDEVYGELDLEESAFREESRYDPSSPYSASKAASDHLVRAWHRTYGLPTIVTNCSNNYGPRHFPEKLIPLIITNALRGLPLPIYGDGRNVRDWLYVEDHASALFSVLKRGRVGETYLIGGRSECSNLDLVHAICAELETQSPRKPEGIKNYADLIRFVSDRPGHDLRYAIDPTKIQVEVGWQPAESLATGLRKTVGWYLENKWWWRELIELKKGQV